MMRRRQRRLEATRQPQRRRQFARHPAKIGAKAGWQMGDCVYADNVDGSRIAVFNLALLSPATAPQAPTMRSIG